MGENRDLVKDVVSVISLQYSMIGILQLTMNRRGGTIPCNISIIVGLRALKRVRNARLSSSEEDVMELKW